MADRKQKSIELSVVIPAYNEVSRVGPTLRSALNYCRSKSRRFEIIVVDDGSTDGTSLAVKQLSHRIRIIRHEQNHGKGDAVKVGMLAAKGNYALMADADGSIEIRALDRLWPLRQKADIVIGSRFLKGGRFRTQHWKRMLVSKIGNLIFRVIFGIKIADTQCGFKLFNLLTTKEIFKKVKEDGFLFDMEVLVLASSEGLKIKEVPIDWHDAEGSKVRAAAQVLRSLVALIKIYLRTRV